LVLISVRQVAIKQFLRPLFTSTPVVSGGPESIATIRAVWWQANL